MKSEEILIANLRALLDRDAHTQAEFAAWMGHHETWISKILLRERGLSLKQIDRAAAFFGFEGYQMIAPGLSVERRSGGERRTGEERRRKVD